LYGFWITVNYRESYGMYACNGILFNHESPRRGTNFVTAKVIEGALKIKKGLAKDIELGNLDSYRDWGHSFDYTKAMIKLLDLDEPDDIVISTGVTNSVRDLCKTVFDKLNMNYEDYIVINKKFIRPQELPFLCGDSTKAKNILGWSPKYDFNALVTDMIDHFEEKIS